MTLSVMDHKQDKWSVEVYNMKEANAVKRTGNEVSVVDDRWYGFDFYLTNEDFSVNITHRTAEKLLYEICESDNAEFFILRMLEDKISRSKWKQRWARLINKETTL